MMRRAQIRSFSDSRHPFTMGGIRAFVFFSRPLKSPPFPVFFFKPSYCSEVPRQGVLARQVIRLFFPSPNQRPAPFPLIVWSFSLSCFFFHSPPSLPTMPLPCGGHAQAAKPFRARRDYQFLPDYSESSPVALLD